MRSLHFAALTLALSFGITANSAFAFDENPPAVEKSSAPATPAIASAQPASGKRTRFEWRASLKGQFMDDAISEAKLVGLYGRARIAHAFSELLTTNLEAGVELETGSTQQLHTTEFRPEQSLKLIEGRVNLLPADFLKFHFGALNQEHHGSPIFISNISFPAVMEFVSIPGIAPWYFSANSQQAIPTSQTFSSRAVGKEGTPTLFTANGRVGYRDPKAFELALRGTWFQFRNLTRGIAHDGRFYGNTILGTGPEGARFFYEYSGWEAGLDSTVHFSPTWKLQLGNSFVNNAKAPRPRNRALLVNGGVKYAGERFQLLPYAGVFRIESDSSPAFYTSKRYGHNNRKGWLGGLELRLVPERVTLDLLYVKAKVIEVSPIQSDRTYIELQLSTEYESF